MKIKDAAITTAAVDVDNRLQVSDNSTVHVLIQIMFQNVLMLAIIFKLYGLF